MSHDAGDREAAERLTQEFRSLDQTLRELIRHSSSTNQTITLSAGGIGVWLCATACMVMLSALLVGGFVFVDGMRKVDKVQDYLNVLYQDKNSSKQNSHVDEKAP